MASILSMVLTFEKFSCFDSKGSYAQHIHGQVKKTRRGKVDCLEQSLWYGSIIVEKREINEG
jgi:hypothetical protein